MKIYIQIQKETVDNFSLDLEDFKLLVRNTNLEYLLERIVEYEEEIYFFFDEILENVCDDGFIIPDQDLNGMWNTFKNLIQHKKTDFESSQIMKNIYNFHHDLNYKDIYEDVGIENLYQLYTMYDHDYNFIRNLISNHCSDFVKHLGLLDLYEQFVFYEYVYRSEEVNLSFKIDFMVANDFYLLSQLIINDVLELTCEIGDTDIQTIMEQYLYILPQESSKRQLFLDLLDKHDNLLSFDMKDTVLYDNSKILLDIFKSHDAKHSNDVYMTRAKKRLMDLINMSNAESNVNSINKITVFSCTCLPYLYYHYNQHNKDHQHAFYRDLFEMLLSNVKFGSPGVFNPLRLGFSKFVVMLMENMDDQLLELIDHPEKHLESYIVHMSRYTNGDISETYKKYFIEYMGVDRKLIHNYSTKKYLNKINISFTNMSWVLYNDDLETFQILTRNLRFSFVRPEMFRFLSPNITEYIISKYEKDTFERMELDIGMACCRFNGSDLVKSLLAISSKCENLILDFKNPINPKYYDRVWFLTNYNYFKYIMKDTSIETICLILDHFYQYFDSKTMESLILISKDKFVSRNGINMMLEKGVSEYITCRGVNIEEIFLEAEFFDLKEFSTENMKDIRNNIKELEENETQQKNIVMQI